METIIMMLLLGSLKKGELYATSATITGAITATSGTFTGTVQASGGYIGGWSIDDDSISAGNTKLYYTGALNIGTKSYYLKMGVGTNHPEVSGLNITGSGGLSWGRGFRRNCNSRRFNLYWFNNQW